MRVLKNYGFSIFMIVGLIVGAIVGLVMGEESKVFDPIANIFLNLVFCVIVPLVFVSIAGAIAGMSDMAKLGKIFVVLLIAILIGGLVTAVLALLTGEIFNPAAGVNLDMAEINATDPDVATPEGGIDIVTMLTTNDFVNLLSLSHMLPLIIFSVIIGVATATSGESGKAFREFLDSATAVLSKMVTFIMYLAPVGVACYFAVLVGGAGANVITGIVRLSIIYVAFCIVFFALQGTVYAGVGGGNEGIRRYWKNILPSLVMAMGTCSSSASLPINMQATKRMGIPEEVGDVVVPVGGLLHKNGVVAVQIFKIIFLFGIFAREFTFKDMVIAVVVAIVSGVIVGTIPTGGFIGELFIITTFGFPTGVVPIIVIMGSLTDPFCTMTSVTSQPALAMTVTRFTEGKNWIKRAVLGEAELEK